MARVLRNILVGLALLLASTPRKDGPLGQMRLSPIARALQEKSG